MNKLIIIGIVVIASIFGACGQLFFKIGSEPFNPLKLLFGLVMYGLATIIYIGALRYGELSSLYGIIALSYVWVMFLSLKYLGETITISKWVGAFGILISVVLIAK